MDNIRLVADSCCELVPSLQNEGLLRIAPLSILLDGVSYIDNGHMNLPHFLKAMKESRHVPKSACPSPDTFADLMRGAETVYAVTLSSKLSGSYNSASIARQMVLEENPHARIHVFDSQSASAGETAVCLKIKQCIDENRTFEETVQQVERFIHQMKTFFIVENLDTLIKSGRMNRITGYVASAMSLRPIMMGEHGEIRLYEKARGSVRAFTRLSDIIGEQCSDFTGRSLVITHCFNEHQAKFLTADAQKRYSFRSVQTAQAGGISTMYANSGGVIIAF